MGAHFVSDGSMTRIRDHSVIENDLMFHTRNYKKSDVDKLFSI